MASTSKPLSLLCLILSLLALSSIVDAYPLRGLNKSKAVIRLFDSRSPSPNEMSDSDDPTIPQYDDIRGDFVTHLLSNIGLGQLGHLNHDWKHIFGSQQPKKRSSRKKSRRDNEPPSSEDVRVDAPDSVNRTKGEDDMRNPQEDPLGFMSDLLGALTGKMEHAIASSIENS
ncbi:hypothetical protein BDV59DRAFT_176471 [Aspergillus ambiguus]|uniref:uncharacterized protein n=1 Tax=Aspergillus ambiguus TaxID=176160 RepID=UPI003CCE3FB8